MVLTKFLNIYHSQGIIIESGDAFFFLPANSSKRVERRDQAAFISSRLTRRRRDLRLHWDI